MGHEGWPRTVRRPLALFGAVVIVVVLGTGYLRVGWQRMESACTADGPGDQPYSSVAFSWSWSPVGFQCAYDDGDRVDTSLWW